MRTKLVHFALALASFQTCLGRLRKRRSAKRSLNQISCLAIVKNVEATENLTLNCKKDDGSTYRIVKVEKSWISEKLKQGELRSGEDTIVLPPRSIELFDMIFIPPEREIVVKNRAIPCKVMIEYVEDENIAEKFEMSCEKEDGTSLLIVGVSSTWIEEKIHSGELDSGDIVMLPPGSTEENGEIKIPPGKQIILQNKNTSTESSDQGLLRAQGKRTILAVIVHANDASTTISRDKLSDDVFGTGLTETDLVNVKSQYAACSYGKLTIEPATERESVIPGDTIGIKNGVTEVTINVNVGGQRSRAMQNVIMMALNKKFGVSNPGQLANHVMFCMPPGTRGSWSASGVVNGWKTVFNDKFCSMVSAQMHEIGHNLGLCHSGEGNHAYGDQSGMMGFSYEQDDTKMCFNAIKSWKLGWYHNRAIEVNPTQGELKSYELIGVADYGTPNTNDQYYVVIKVGNYYINFNRAIGMNEETREGRNQVMIDQGGINRGCPWSTLVAKLDTGGEYAIANFNGKGFDLQILVTGIDVSMTPAVATVNICLGICS